MYVHIWINQAAKERRIGVHSKNKMSIASTLHITMKLVNTPTGKPYPIDTFTS